MRIRSLLVGMLLLTVLAACGGSSAASQAPGVTAAPGATATAAPAITPAGPVATATVPAATIPAVTAGPLPSFAGDPTLAAAFPTQVAGQPVGKVTTARLLDFFTAFGAPQATIDQLNAAMQALGIDPSTVIFGAATATVSGSSVQITAVRVPGHDANILIQHYQQISGSSFQEGDTLTQEQSGGKNVTVERDSNGYASTWLYAHDDILWSVNTSSADEAAAVFTALP